MILREHKAYRNINYISDKRKKTLQYDNLSIKYDIVEQNT